MPKIFQTVSAAKKKACAKNIWILANAVVQDMTGYTRAWKTAIATKYILACAIRMSDQDIAELVVVEKAKPSSVERWDKIMAKYTKEAVDLIPGTIIPISMSPPRKAVKKRKKMVIQKPENEQGKDQDDGGEEEIIKISAIV